MSRLPDTRDSLLVRLRDHDDVAAWHEFVTLYEPWILGWARRRGLQEADARELAQELLVRLSQAVARWRPGSPTGSFRSWLAVTARRLAIDRLTRPGRRPQSPGGSDLHRRLGELEAPTDDAVELDFRRRLFEWGADRVKARCGEATWSAFRMTCLEGQTPEDAAARLKISIGQVYVARSRVMARLRDEIARWHEHEGS
ncbi:MAG TPA: sigma-70 family RNA polymerase sigma factor [Pirellulaceae bacterium]|nr:sigma-70 family RNA polymerase sigma factor [Pirellulaceae bacterium]